MLEIGEVSSAEEVENSCAVRNHSPAWTVFLSLLGWALLCVCVVGGVSGNKNH